MTLLDDPAAIRAFHATFLRGVQARLDRLHSGLQALKAEGLPVDSIAPMGAIYLTARFHPFGRTHARTACAWRPTRRCASTCWKPPRVAVVPFQAFGSKEEDGWFRLSVGAVSEQDLADALPRVAQALRATS